MLLVPVISLCLMQLMPRMLLPPSMLLMPLTQTVIGAADASDAAAGRLGSVQGPPWQFPRQTGRLCSGCLMWLMSLVLLVPMQPTSQPSRNVILRARWHNPKIALVFTEMVNESREEYDRSGEVCPKVLAAILSPLCLPLQGLIPNTIFLSIKEKSGGKRGRSVWGRPLVLPRRHHGVEQVVACLVTRGENRRGKKGRP